jgi:hypothetical protein
MPATFNHGLVKGRNASGPITKKRFVVRDTAAADGETVKQASSATGDTLAGISIFSVSLAEIAHGKGCSVVMSGRAVVTASETLAVGDIVTADAEGKAAVATTGDWVGGVVDEPAANAGDDCSIVIACDGSVAA